MERVTVSPKYQVVIPQTVRERLDLSRSEGSGHFLCGKDRADPGPVNQV